MALKFFQQQAQAQAQAQAPTGVEVQDEWLGQGRMECGRVALCEDPVARTLQGCAIEGDGEGGDGEGNENGGSGSGSGRGSGSEKEGGDEKDEDGVVLCGHPSIDTADVVEPMLMPDDCFVFQPISSLT